jgi:phenylpropionate dioxygenase-like ring-hydroxylating dioxygenase large terminal subunit
MVDKHVLDDWYVIGRSADIYQGTVKGVRLLGENLVIWRSDQSNSIQVWRDQCPHRGAQLSLGRIDSERDALQCPYHGWRYGTDGQCSFIPAHPDTSVSARFSTTKYKVQEKYGYIWTSLGDPPADVPTLDEFANDEFRVIHCGPYDYAATGTRAIENFLDMAHFPYVHFPYLGEEPYTEVKDYDVELMDDGRGISATRCRFFQPSNNVVKDGAEMSYSYRVLQPLTAVLTKDPAGDDPRREAIVIIVQPVDEFKSIGWMSLAVNFDFDVPEKKFTDFQDVITLQDLPVVESQVPQRLPLEMADEFHQPCDKLSIAYRRWLKELNFTYGTSLAKGR